MADKAEAMTGTLPPPAAAFETLDVGEEHLKESMQLTFLKNFYGGLLLSAGGLLALLLATGFPEIGDRNPGLVRLLQGASFPIGLVVVYFVGAELYTGYPMWLVMCALERKGRPSLYIRTVLIALAGNLLGALFWAGVQSYLTEALTEEPWRSRIIEQIDSDITDQQWHVIFLRAIGCGFLVTVAMFMGSQNNEGVSKALGLHLPFFISSCAKFPHTVEYFYLASTGIMLGARLTVAQFFWKCALPIMLGNAVGGGFTGVYNWYVFIYPEERKKDGSGEGRWLPADGE